MKNNHRFAITQYNMHGDSIPSMMNNLGKGSKVARFKIVFVF